MQEKASETVLQGLVSAGVLEERDGVVALTNQFEQRIKNKTLSEQYSGPPIDFVVDPEAVDAEYKRRLRAYVETLQTFELDLTGREIVAAASSILETVDGSVAEGDDLSVTVDGEEFSTLVEVEENVLALIYKNSCDPCDRVRSKLKTIEDKGKLPPGIVVVEIPGPENKHLLHDHFDVVGAPTLLFCQSGRVEMRLTGDVHLKQIQSDVNRLYA